MFADFLSDDLELSFKQDDINDYRIKIGAHILAGKYFYDLICKPSEVSMETEVNFGDPIKEEKKAAYQTAVANSNNNEENKVIDLLLSSPEMEEKVRHQPHDEESEVIDLLTPKKY
jgi:hypothetical protein